MQAEDRYNEALFSEIIYESASHVSSDGKTPVPVDTLTFLRRNH